MYVIEGATSFRRFKRDSRSWRSCSTIDENVGSNSPRSESPNLIHHPSPVLPRLVQQLFQSRPKVLGKNRFEIPRRFVRAVFRIVATFARSSISLKSLEGRSVGDEERGNFVWDRHGTDGKGDEARLDRPENSSARFVDCFHRSHVYSGKKGSR